MLHGQPAAEGFFQAADHLGGQADLRYQHQRLAAQFQRFFDQFQEHGCLAAAGDAVEQCCPRLAGDKVALQGIAGRLLFRRELQRAGVKGDGGKQVDGFIPAPRRQHPLVAQGFERRVRNALLVQCPPAQGSILQGGHRCQLLGAGLWLLGQLPRQSVDCLLGAGKFTAHHPAPVFFYRLVLRTVRDHCLDCLEPGAEGAVLQKVYQRDQVGGQAGFRRGSVQQGFQPGIGGGIPGAFQHHRHAGMIARPKGRQHHAARPHPALQFRRDEIGIEFVKMDGSVADRHLCNLWQTRRPLSAEMM